MGKIDHLHWFGVIGLLSTGLAAIVNLLTFTISATWLEISSMVHLRLVLNTALIASVLLCLGWDSACVRLRSNQKEQLDLVAFLGLTLFGSLALILGWLITHPFQAYLQGMGLGAVFAYPIIHFNLRRSKGGYLGYFLGLNVADKVFRAFSILSAIYWMPSHMIELIFAGSLVWNSVLKASSTSSSLAFRYIPKFFARPNRLGNVSFLFSSLFMFYLSRSLYFIIPSDRQVEKVTVDLAMIIGSFLFVPVQSTLKISEAEQYRSGEPIFKKVPIKTLRKLMLAEVLIVFSACLMMVAYAIYVMTDQFILWIGLVVLSGFVVTSSMPNMVQIAIHSRDNLWRAELLIYLFISVTAYLISPLFVNGLFVAYGVMALGYLLFCFRLANRFGLNLFFKQRMVRTTVLILILLIFSLAIFELS